MPRQFYLPAARTNDAETFPDFTADFSVITFQYNGILFGRRDTVEPQVVQQTGKVARTSVGRSTHAVNVRLRQFACFLHSGARIHPRNRAHLGAMVHLEARIHLGTRARLRTGSCRRNLFTRRRISSFLIPSFARRVRVDVFFSFLFFLFMQVVFVAASRDTVYIIGFLYTVSTVSATVSGALESSSGCSDSSASRQ